MSSNRRTGNISIPIEIVKSSRTTDIVYPRYTSSDFTCSPPRQYSTKILDREFNGDDCHSFSCNAKRLNNLRLESDFLHPQKFTSSSRQSCDTSNDYHVPTSCHQQGTFPNSHDRSHSPASQRDESPTRSSRSKESDFKISNDQQVPSTIEQAIPRDANSLALEKLEHIKQNLANLHEQVDAFSGHTRDDRVYKQLDEHAVSLMLRCDELTDVSADIKEKRKEMIQHVQNVVAKLESKVPINPSSDLNSNSIQSTLPLSEPLGNISTTTEQISSE